MTCSHPSLEALGHSITCKHCLGLVMSWGVTTPMVGPPKLHSLNADVVAVGVLKDYRDGGRKEVTQ